MRKAKREQERGRLIDPARLKDAGTKQVFKKELENRFQILGEEQEMNIDTFNQAFRQAGENVLGYKKVEERRMDPEKDLAKNCGKESNKIKHKLNEIRKG